VERPPACEGAPARSAAGRPEPAPRPTPVRPRIRRTSLRGWRGRSVARCPVRHARICWPPHLLLDPM